MINVFIRKNYEWKINIKILQIIIIEHTYYVCIKKLPIIIIKVMFRKKNCLTNYLANHGS